jgi:hypothetical protein
VLHRQPQGVELFEHHVQGLVGALEHRGEGQVEGVALALQELAGGHRFLDPQLGEVNVGPAGEAVFLVPGGFAVAKKDDLVHSVA